MTSVTEQSLEDRVRALTGASPLPFFSAGEWRRGAAGEVIDVVAPSTGRPVATASLAGAADVDRAVAAAKAAFPAWSAMPSEERAALLHRFADLLEARCADIGWLESVDVGKPLGDATGFDVPFGTNAYRYFADLARQDSRRSLEVPGLEAYHAYLPRGVCGLIYPWNAPFLLSSWGIAPALASGNTVVVKPAEITPLSTILVAQLFVEAGFPDGVVNFVPGRGDDAGAALVRHPDVRMISFTGSPRVGREIAQEAGRRLIPSKLELGGKGAAVVFDDVDVRATARALAAAVTLNAGQVCCTATRWIVNRRIFDEFVGAASDALSALVVGPGHVEGADMGPVTSEAQRGRVLGYLDRGLSTGASYLLEGGAATVPGYEDGYYVKPALLTGPAENVCAQEEIFGPVAYLVPFDNDADAVRLVNNCEYGLANSVWSGDVDRARCTAEQLVSGSTWINAHNVFSYGLPYGGVNLSGWGGGVNAIETLGHYRTELTLARPLT